MIGAIRTGLTAMLQALKVFAFRHFYRFSSARSWRGQVGPAPFTDMQVPAAGGTIGARLYPNSQG
ncbi:MAG: hypothetical protein KDI10_05315, partial [Halioglobus sp.]|nr:hypothetical protein [Halioglobus sp.]